MNSFKKNKGITLIALVITIIVMLILVAVTINMAVNGGLFGYAGNATRETDKAIETEKTIASGKITVDGVLYDSVDDYLNDNPHADTYIIQYDLRRSSTKRERGTSNM